MPPRLALVLGLLLALLAPAAAQAATFTVDPADGSPCSASDTTCPTIASAVSAAKGGDTVKILKGTYAETVDVATGKDALVLEGTGIGEVKITGKGTGDVVTIASKDVTLKGLTVDVPSNGKSAVVAGATGAKLVAVVLQRSTASSENVAVVSVPDAGTASLEGAFVIQNAGAAGTPAIRSTGAGLSLADTVVISSTGPAVQIEGGEGNLIARSTLAATEPASDAVRVLSDDAGKRGVTTDSTVIIGGANAGGILAKSTGTAAGDIALAVRHATIAGSAKGIVLDASAATGQGILTGGTAAGSIDAKVFSSIVHGASSTARYQPTLPVQGTANTASLTFADSDAPPATPNNGTVEMGGASNTEDAKLFIPKSLKLRPDAPLIDKGGALQAGESAKDFEGDAREADGPDPDATPQSDVGADEYVNGAPKAIFGITNSNPRQNEAIGFVSGSTDPELAYGGSIVEYRWDFGDGTKETTSAAGVAHTYTQTGTFQATLQVVDNAGAASPVSPAQEVVVKDGIPPEVSITNPTEGQKLNLKSTYLLGRKRPKPRQLTVLGKAADANGITSVEVALYVVKRDKVKRAKKKKRRRARASADAPKLCEFYSGRLFAKKDCTKEIWLKASLIPGGTWAISTKKGLRLPAGLYQMRVRATDGSGLLSSEFSTKARTLVNFRVR